MTEWNEQHLEELVRKMRLERAPRQEKVPIHQSLFVPGFPRPILTQIMRLDAAAWAALGYDENDRVSVTRYLGSLKCRTDDALSVAARHQQPLTLELAKALIDAEACDKGALSIAAIYQQPLTLELAKLLIDAGAFDKEALSFAAKWQQPLSFELAKLLVDAGAFSKEALRAAAVHQRPLTPELARVLIDAGCDPTVQDHDGWDALVSLAWGKYPVDPQVTDLFLSAGCRTDLDGCKRISDETRLRFDQILKEHAEWKEQRGRMVAENSPAGSAVDWGR